MLTDEEKVAWQFQKELPADKSILAKAWKLLESYSGIPPDEIEAHVVQVRDKAFAIFRYPCIGRWRFLDLYLTETPEYPSVLARLKAGESLLDMGCCFGQVLRQLAFDGAPDTGLAGSDLRPEFVDLGYELFRDRDSFAARFATGDVLDPADAELQSLDGKFDIIHAASFFHLFGWDDQVRVGKRIVRFFKPGAEALVLGRQVGSHEPPTPEASREQGEKMYRHNIESFQRLWDVIGDNTGTKWRVTGELVDVLLPGNVEWVNIRFAVFKVE